ncbi:SLC13 family permease [Treponema pedis]|uniref:SLC13 family permease n=1 Tax=Treponema pedis TaxID=409322 RepID=UPI00040749DB|nr:SLC13 family permease [Treponema pedis]
MKKIKFFHLAVIIPVSILITVINPLNLDLNQKILVSALVMTTALWVTEAVHKTIACIFLLFIFSVFGKTKLYGIVSFAWSDTILLVITTTLLSVGIMKTGIVHKYAKRIFTGNSFKIFKLLILPYILGIVLVFLIPQAFARVIIIGAVLNDLIITANDSEKKAKQAIIFNGFIAVTVTYMFFNSGDIVLNQAAVNFASDLNPEVKEALNFSGWFKLMTLPSIITSCVCFFTVYFIFYKDLKHFSGSMISSCNTRDKEDSKSKELASFCIMGGIIILWATQSIHRIPYWIPAGIGVLIMFALKSLNFSDLKSVNFHLLLFLITVFNIGKVLTQAGVTSVIFTSLQTLIPDVNSSLYLLIIAAVTMIMHICIGSSVATMSVVLPIILPLTVSLGYNPAIITLISYIVVNIHFLLPFHHVIAMIGTAKEYYSDKYMLRFGIVMTIITLVLLWAVYIPWWKFLRVLSL